MLGPLHFATPDRVCECTIVEVIVAVPASAARAAVDVGIGFENLARVQGLEVMLVGTQFETERIVPLQSSLQMDMAEEW